MAVIATIEKIHELIIFAKELQHSIPTIQKLAENLVERLNSLDDILRRPDTRQKLEKKNANLQYLANVIENAIEYLRKFQNLNRIEKLIALQSAQDNFNKVQANITNAVVECSLNLKTDPIDLSAEIRDISGECPIDLFVKDRSFQLLHWLDQPEGHHANLQTRLDLPKMNNRCFVFTESSQNPIFSNFLAARSVMISVCAPCRWRVISNTFHAIKDQEPSPNCVENFCFELKAKYEARVPVLFYTSSLEVKETIRVARESESSYMFAGVTDDVEVVKVFGNFTTLFWIGPWKRCEAIINQLQDKGVAVARFIESDKSDKLDDFASAVIEQLSEHDLFSHQEATKLRFIVAFEATESEASRKTKVEAIKDIISNKKWKFDIMVLSVDGTLDTAIKSQLPQDPNTLFFGSPGEVTDFALPIKLIKPPFKRPFHPGKLNIIAIECKNLAPVDRESADPYVILFLNQQKIDKTPHRTRTVNPSWPSLSFQMDIKTEVNIKLEIWDKNTFFDDYIGGALIPVTVFSETPSGVNEKTFPITDVLAKGSPAPQGTITLTYTYTHLI